MENNNQEYNTVTLMLDDNTECECAIIRIFPAGDNDYIALLPLEGEAADNDEVYLYRYKVEGYNEPVLENIESDEEYELVSEAFDEELDAMEYEDLYEERAVRSSSIKRERVVSLLYLCLGYRRYNFSFALVIAT